MKGDRLQDFFRRRQKHAYKAWMHVVTGLGLLLVFLLTCTIILPEWARSTTVVENRLTWVSRLVFSWYWPLIGSLLILTPCLMALHFKRDLGCVYVLVVVGLIWIMAAGMFLPLIGTLSSL